MSNLWCHAKICWGQESVDTASETKDIQIAQDAMALFKEGPITDVFEWSGTKKCGMYSHHQHTKAQSQQVSQKS